MYILMPPPREPGPILRCPSSPHLQRKYLYRPSPMTCYLCRRSIIATPSPSSLTIVQPRLNTVGRDDALAEHATLGADLAAVPIFLIEPVKISWPLTKRQHWPFQQRLGLLFWLPYGLNRVEHDQYNEPIAAGPQVISQVHRPRREG